MSFNGWAFYFDLTRNCVPKKKKKKNRMLCTAIIASTHFNCLRVHPLLGKESIILHLFEIQQSCGSAVMTPASVYYSATLNYDA